MVGKKQEDILYKRSMSQGPPSFALRVILVYFDVAINFVIVDT